NFIVGLKKEFKEGGSPYYTYKGVKLQILDKEVLKKILGKIQSEVARINADRISKQIESIQQAQRTIAATQQAARASAVTVRSPVLPPNPPQTPRAPTTQPYVPRTPPPPPVPQRR
ncbi:MAG: hypothetical protein NT036_02710, partial [Candidatus Omnitrophica bacterium]|nr:hypothetical protein [Candidatus Omnitrophota bacterium]